MSLFVFYATLKSEHHYRFIPCKFRSTRFTNDLFNWTIPINSPDFIFNYVNIFVDTGLLPTINLLLFIVAIYSC